ncbi:MAG TPA: ATP-binding protein [Gemmataceae bacterium]|jgi:heavy metal sensor kinase
MHFGPLKHLPRTLRFQLTFWNTVAILVLVAAALWGVREGLRWTLIHEMDKALEEDVKEVSSTIASLWTHMEELHAELNRKANSHSDRGWYVRIFKSRKNGGELIWASEGAPDLHTPMAGVVRHGPYNRGEYRQLQRPIPAAGGAPALVVRVGANRKSVDDDIWRLEEMILMAFALILVMAPLSGYWLAGRATRPLATILQTTARLHPDNLGERLPLRGSGDELDQLSATINGMLDRLAAHLEQQRAFVANAAHELRSPLAAMRTSLEVVLERDRSPSEYRDLLGDMIEECAGLANLINHLLLLAEGDAGLLHADGQVRLDELVERAVDMFQGIAEQRDVELRAERMEPVTVRVNRIHLREVIHNLIDNALKFTPAGGKVRVEVDAPPDSGQARLRILDTGMGISPEDLPKVFERFFRADKARQRAQPIGGNGLGLCICQAIVQSYGGQILIDSVLEQGTTATVSLPVSATSPSPTVSAETSSARKS